MPRPTKEMLRALKAVYNRQPMRKSFLQFRRTAWLSNDCLMVPWCGMVLGIERDGYTHS